MNWKIMLVGGVVFYVAMFAVSMATGPLIHEGYLEQEYRANDSFWRPELNQDPPDMGALMPRWIATGLITAIIMAGIYSCLRGALGGGAIGGLKFGLMVSVLAACFMAGYSGMFALPDKIWIVWALEQPLYYLPGGAALGWVSEKLAPST